MCNHLLLSEKADTFQFLMVTGPDDSSRLLLQTNSLWPSTDTSVQRVINQTTAESESLAFRHVTYGININ